MPLLSKSRLERLNLSKSMYAASRELREAMEKGLELKESFDIFLSHRYLDAQHVLLLKEIIEDFGFTVFVDWIENAGLDRANVTKEVAAYLREAMNRSKSLLYAVSPNASSSKWMPWELGYSDARHGRVAIVPITELDTDSESYSGQEYLGLYPYVTLTRDRSQKNQLWINDSRFVYVLLQEWIDGNKPTYHPPTR